MNMSWVLLATVLVGYLGTSDAIKCYTCSNLLSGDSCADPFGSSAQKSGCSACGKVKGKQGSTQVVLRTCETTSLASKCASATENGVTGDVCICNTDLCNSSTRASVTITSIIISGLSVLLSRL